MEDSVAIIKKHDFEDAKSKIQQFSQNLPTNPSFEKVETDAGLFGLLDHDVTGAELNTFIGDVQRCFINQNSSLRTVVQEFGEVYKALDALDKDYIQAIIIAINEAKASSDAALKAQKNIGNTLSALQITVDKLKTLNSQVSTLDQKIGNLETWITNISKLLTETKTSVNQTQKAQQNTEATLSALQLTMDELKDLNAQVSSFDNRFKILEEQMLDNKILNKKILIAYLFGGFACIASVVQFILMLSHGA